MRKLSLLIAICLWTTGLPEAARGQASDAFGGGPLVAEDPMLDSYVSNLMKSIRMHQSATQDLPSVLVRFEPGKQNICVEGVSSPGASEIAEQLVRDAIHANPPNSRKNFSALLQFHKPRLASEVSTVPTTPSATGRPKDGGKPFSGSANTSPSSMRSRGSDTAAECNNDGVRALNSGDSATAIADFQKALQIRPEYQYARDNLSVAYNNAALKAPPATAMKYMHRALYIEPSNSTTTTNLNALIASIGKDPSRFEDRLNLAQQCRLEKDDDGAQVELLAALRIRDDAGAHVQLGDLYKATGRKEEAITQYKAALATKRLDDAEIASVNVKLGELYESKREVSEAVDAFGEAIKHKPNVGDLVVAVGEGLQQGVWAQLRPEHTPCDAAVTRKSMTACRADVDFGPYMADLQRKIKHNWHPPAPDTSRRVVLMFKIHQSGLVTDPRIDERPHPTGAATADDGKAKTVWEKAAIEAVMSSSPVRPLPTGAPDQIDVQFTFDCNVFGKGPYMYRGNLYGADPVSYEPLNIDGFRCPWVQKLFHESESSKLNRVCGKTRPGKQRTGSSDAFATHGVTGDKFRGYRF